MATCCFVWQYVAFIFAPIGLVLFCIASVVWCRDYDGISVFSRVHGVWVHISVDVLCVGSVRLKTEDNKDDDENLKIMLTGSKGPLVWCVGGQIIMFVILGQYSSLFHIYSLCFLYI